MSNIPSQLAFQVCSPIKQVRLDLGQSENSCPSSILIPKIACVLREILVKMNDFQLFQSWFLLIFKHPLCKIQEIWEIEYIQDNFSLWGPSLNQAAR